jgi:hypothetical protein
MPNLLNIRPFKLKPIPWGWTNWDTTSGQYAHYPPGKIQMPKDFMAYFDWNRWELSGQGWKTSALSTQDHKSIFTTAARFMGYEKLLVDFPPLDEIADIYLKWNTKVLSEFGEKLEFFIIGDDIAHKDNLFCSPQKLREWYFPHLRRLVNLAKKFSILVVFHADGKISSILDDLVEMGIDILWLSGDDLIGEKAYKNMIIWQSAPHMDVRKYDVLNPLISIEYNNGVAIDLTSRELVNYLKVKQRRGECTKEAIEKMFRDMEEDEPEYRGRK